MAPGTTISRRSAYLLLALLTLAALSAAQTSTTLVSVTRTTTVTATATDYEHACQNFYGACVVYGTDEAAPYTTTVYRYAPTSSPSTSIVTATTTFVATTTAANSGACADFTGACVVYGSTDGAASTTVYYAGSDNGAHDGLGNGDGYIGQAGSDGESGQLGGTAGAVALKSCTYEALVAFVLAVGMAMLLV